MDPHDDFQRRRDIIQSIQKLDSDVSSLNQQKQQLLRELKSIPISEHLGSKQRGGLGELAQILPASGGGTIIKGSRERFEDAYIIS